jgi:hypothetical protein
MPEEYSLVMQRTRRWRRDGIAVETVAQTNQEKPEPGIDRAIREYVETHPGVIAEDDLRIREQFVDHIREVAQTERQEYQREIALVQVDEHRASGFFLSAIALALVLFSVGAFLLLFLPKMVTIGTISALLSLLSGGATALLRWHIGGLKTKRAAIEERQRDSRDTALLIQAAMSHADQKKRSSEISRVTQLLMARVTRPTPQPGPTIPIRAKQRLPTKRRSGSKAQSVNGETTDGS